MIVCCCKAICSEKIAALIDQGADSLQAIGALCGAGTDCGSCRDYIEEMIEEAQPSTSPARRRPGALRVLGAGAA